MSELERGNELANENAPGADDVLRGALSTLHEFAPELAFDLDAREQRILAQLNLARFYLGAHREFLANEMMDEAIRLALGAELPATRLGPKVDALYRERAEALARQGTATIEVECTTPCTIYVNEQLTGTKIRGLALGTHHVWIEDKAGARAPSYEQITLSAAGETVLSSYGPTPPPFETSPIEEPHARRLMPRWAEITFAAVGAGLVVAGGTALAFHGKCPGGLDPRADALDCPRIYESRSVGATLSAIGGASLLTGGVLLSVDEVRVGGREGLQAMATWTVQF